MLFGFIIDFLCKFVLIGLAVVVVGFVLAVAILMIGEKMKWW